MSNEKNAIIIAIVALIVAIAGCAFALTANNDGSTGLYIGEHEVTSDGNLFDNKYGNLKYDRLSNTLYISQSVIDQEGAGCRIYDDIMISHGELDQVGFIISYEGTKLLNIVFIGNCLLLGDPSQTEYNGGIYIANEAVVNVSGPGLLQSRYVNHSLFYGEEAEIMIDGVNMNVDGQIDVPLAAKILTVEDSNIDLSTEGGYAGVYTSRETVIKDSSIETRGFDNGVFLGSTYIYDSVIEVDANVMGFRVYACSSYNSSLISTSANAGMYFYDPLHFNGGYLYSSAANLYGVYSGDTTLDFNDAVVEAYVTKGNAIQAWHTNFHNCMVVASSDNGSGIYANYNPVMDGDDVPRIIIDNSKIDAIGSVGAIWAVGEIELVDSTLKSGCKILSADGPKKGIFFSAVCDSSVSELKMFIEGNHGEPINASKTVKTETTS